jgi:orotate phosphoribosyltransferase
MLDTEYPEEHIKRGDFRLHSGGFSNLLYDVNSLITNQEERSKILRKIRNSYSDDVIHYVGVATGGAIIAGLASNAWGGNFSMIKDGEFKGKTPTDRWMLIDDVLTTGQSLENALELVDSEPENIFVVMDRRRERKPIQGIRVVSLYHL